MKLEKYIEGMHSVRVIRMFDEKLIDVQHTFYADPHAARGWYTFSVCHDMDSNVEREFITKKLIELLNEKGEILATTDPQASRE